MVWSAEDIIAGRKVVLKFVPRELKNFETAVTQLKESFNNIHELQHQHICPVYKPEEDFSLGYYHTMKWLDGETLDVYIIRTVGRGNPLSLDETLRILRPVAEALDYAHGKRVIHRDVKPSNIFVVLDDEKKIKDVQVIDFGLASEIRSTMTRVSQMKFDTSGTRPYMAPEQWRARRQTGQTDQYALAVVAYELLAGYLPFESDDLEALRLAVLQDEPEPVLAMPENVNVALRKAMAKDIGERFENCTDFIKSLGGTEIPVTNKPVPPPIPEKRTRTPTPPTPNVESLMKRGHLFLEDAEWKQADEYFDRVLDIDPEYAPAYVGKLCIELQVRNEERLGDNEKPISEHKHFQKAVRFADEGYKAKVEGYDEKVRDKLRQEQYNRLFQAKSRASTEEDFAAVARQLREMNGYKNTEELAKECDKYACKLKQQREKLVRQEEQKRQEQYEILHEKSKSASTEEDWVRLAEQYRGMNGYRNTQVLANECTLRKQEIRRRVEEEERKRLSTYKQLCEEFKAASTSEKFRKLALQFQAMNGYKDAVDRSRECEKIAQEVAAAKKKKQHDFFNAVKKGNHRFVALRVYLETKSLKLQHI